MKIREIICEDQGIKEVHKYGMPNVYLFPHLQNQDPYLQYRFGMALATAGGKPGETRPNYEPYSAFGEKLAVVATTPEEEQMIKNAAKMYGPNADHYKVTTEQSEEIPSTHVFSPVAKRKKNRYGV